MNRLHRWPPMILVALAVGLLTLGTGSTWAQFRTQPGNGGLGGIGSGGTGFGGTGFGGSGFGNTGFGNTGFQQQPGSGLNLAGRQSGANPFAATFGSPFGQTNASGMQGGLGNQGLYGGLGNQFGMNNRGMMGNNMFGNNMMGGYGGVGRTASFVMRFPTVVPPALGVVDARLEKLVAAITGESAEGRSIKLRMDGSTVVLTGTVTSSHQKHLAEAMLRLEPGVYDLRNDLLVNEAGPAPRPTTP